MEPNNRICNCKPSITLDSQLTMTNYTEVPAPSHPTLTPSHCMVTYNI